MIKVIKISYVIFLLLGITLYSFSQGNIIIEDDGIDVQQGFPLEIWADGNYYFDYDIGIYTILEPASGGGFTEEEPVTVRIYNFGNLTQTSFDVSYSINGGEPVIETVDTILPPFSSVDYTFVQTLNLQYWSSFLIEARTHLVNDEDSLNDYSYKYLFGPILWPAYYEYGCIWQDGFFDFHLNQLENMGTGCENNTGTGYSRYLDLDPALLYTGYDHTLLISSNGLYDNFASVWIDWNDDYFLDETEMIIDNFEILVDEWNYIYFSIPDNAPLGQHAMRARTNRSDSCNHPYEEYLYGEAEDYWVVVSEAAYLLPPVNLQGQSTIDDVLLFWSAPGSDYPNSKVELLGYNIYENNSLIGFTEEQFFNVYDLLPGSYSYHVTAVYEEGESGSSNTVVLDFILQIPVPENVSATTYNDINVHIECDSISFLPIEYIFLRGYEYIGSSNSPEFNDVGLSPGNYYYSVVANYNGNESDPSYPEGVEVFPPPPPPILTAVYQDPNIVLNWDAWTYGMDTTLYNIYHSYEESAWQFLDITGDTIYNDNPGIPGLHCYMISVMNAWPDPVNSNEACEIISLLIEKEFQNVSIFPNPANDVLNISSSEKINSLEIFNANGVNVLNQYHHQQEIQLSVTGFSAGLYWIKVKTEKQVFTEKVIIK